MKRTTAVVLCSVAIVVAGALLPAAAQARSCGYVYVSSARMFGSVEAQVRVIRGHVSCASARRVARAFFSGRGHYVNNGYSYNSYWAIRGGWRGDGRMNYWTFLNRHRHARVGGTFE